MPLRGREKELRVLEDLLLAARAGGGGALVVRGPAGIGKTVLVAAATAAVPGMRTLRATGTEFEARLPFAGLHQLCEPLLEHLGELPPPQADAVRRALGLADSPAAGGTDLILGAGLLGLLAAAARIQPLVCVVDDAQWLDPASTEALAFAARRLAGRPVAVVVVVRDEDGAQGPLTLRALPHLRPGGLPERVARELLDAEVRAPLDPAVRDRVIAEARGNPLALLELPRAAGSAELVGDSRLPHRDSLVGTLEESFLQRLSGLPAPSRAFVTLAAAEPTGDPALLWRAATGLGLPNGVALPAEATGLLGVGTRVVFRHPLVRSAAYDAAALDERRAAHAALARATDPAADPDRRAWHLALAAHGPDEAVAAELARSAGRAQARGGLAATAAFLERAARLTPDAADRADRLVEAAAAARSAGAPETALELLALASSSRLDERQEALVQALRARAAFDQRRDGGALDLLLAAGRGFAQVDPVQAREVLFEAFAAAVFAGRLAERGVSADIATLVDRLPPVDPTSADDALFQALLVQETQGRTAAAPLLRRGVDALLAGDDDGPPATGGLWMGCSAAQELGDENAFRALAVRQLTAVRRAGALAALPVTLSYRALGHVHAGEFDQAQALVDEAHRAAAELEVPPMLYVDVTIAAWRGDEARTEDLVRVGTADATARGEGRLLSALEYARAVLLNSRGRYAEALDACRPAAELDEHSYRVWIVPDFVEAAVRAGRPDLAAPVHERWREEAVDSDWMAGLIARCSALLDDGAEAETHHRASLEHLARGHGLPQLGRSHLLYGEWLRREGRVRDARAQLTTAHEVLHAVGARGFAARAARELAATGARARPRRSPSSGPAGLPLDLPGGQLTAQERHVARLVATGATTKEAAAALFLSHRTVDAHLRSIFAKLGITSRRELRGHPELLEHSRTQPPA